MIEPDTFQASQGMGEAILEALDSYRTCVETIAYCLKKGGRFVDSDHMQILKDCSDVCTITAGFLLRNSQFHNQVCELCAEICEKCAASCEAIDPVDTQLKACAEVCRKCAKSCRKI